MQQHVGGPARPVVLVGQTVRKGQLIAEAQGNISAPVHAPTSGRRSARSAKSPRRIRRAWRRWRSRSPPTAPTRVERDPVSRSLRAVAGGDRRLHRRRRRRRPRRCHLPGGGEVQSRPPLKVTTLIVNGGECEPYLSSDDRIMRDRAAEVVDGLRIVMHAIGAARRWSASRTTSRRRSPP
jgi:electron transport complex protein RnfC